MTKRLQVLLKDAEYREIQRVARSRRMSIAECVRQALELDFRAPVLQMVLPDPETLEFWRATADYPQEVADRIAKFSRRMQQCASASTSACPRYHLAAQTAEAIRQRHTFSLGFSTTPPRHRQQRQDSQPRPSHISWTFYRKSDNLIL